jgi:S1/P1 Nuclease
MKNTFFPRSVPAFVSLFLLFCAAPYARAWGCKGHQTIALLAEKNLTPEARQFLDKLLADNPPDPQLKRYCGSTRDLLADASTWPDDVRGDLKNGPWHYINIPRGTPRGPVDSYCGNQGCITKAIAEQLAILTDKSAEPRKRANAIRYVVHFVGDLHMPLHAITNNDEGGNCVPVGYFRRRPHEHHNSYSPNLHAVWDTAIVERDMEGADPSEYAETILQNFSADIESWQHAGVHVDDWAWESYDIANTIVYPELAPPVPTQTPTPVHSCTDDNSIGERMLHLHIFAGEHYQQIAAPIVEERLVQAGIRLALILNDAAKPAN